MDYNNKATCEKHNLDKNLPIWRPPRLSELTPILFHMELTHLGSEASIYSLKISLLPNIFQFKLFTTTRVITYLSKNT